MSSLCKLWEHSFSVSDLVSVYCQINSYTTCVTTITTITTTVARLPLFPMFLYRHHRPSNATTSIALCAITKNRFYHLRLSTRLRKTLHSTQRLWWATCFPTWKLFTEFSVSVFKMFSEIYFNTYKTLLLYQTKSGQSK